MLLMLFDFGQFAVISAQKVILKKYKNSNLEFKRNGFI
jgi:hypothetical protein